MKYSKSILVVFIVMGVHLFVHGQSDSIYFENYNVSAKLPAQNAKLNLASNADAKMFKTRITNAYQAGKVDFAGHYISVLFGCGADCIMGFIMDVNTGKIYSAPLGEKNSCSHSDEKALFKKESRLFISAVCKDDSENEKLYYIAYLWDEEQKKFIKLESQYFLKKNLPKKDIKCGKHEW